MRKQLIFLVMISFLIACAAKQEKEIELETKASQPFKLSEATFTKMDGSVFKLTDIKKPVLLNLWATWCGPCIREMPDLAVAKQALEGNIHFVIASDEELNHIKKFSDRKLKDIEVVKANFPLSELDIMGLPTTLLLNASGKEIKRIVGARPWSSDEIIELFNSSSQQ